MSLDNAETQASSAAQEREEDALKTRKKSLLLAAAMATLGVSDYANATPFPTRTGVQIETAQHYATCGGGDLTSAGSSGAHFAAEMARVNPLGFVIPSSPNTCAGQNPSACWWQDSLVYDTDFIDSDLNSN